MVLEREGGRGRREPRGCVYLFILIVKGWRVCRGWRDSRRNRERCAVPAEQDKEHPPLGAHI